MRKIRQIVSLLGIALLVLLYVLTLVFAISDKPNSMTLFKAAVSATVIIPVIIYILGLFLRIGKSDKSEFDEALKRSKKENETSDTKEK